MYFPFYIQKNKLETKARQSKSNLKFKNRCYDTKKIADLYRWVKILDEWVYLWTHKSYTIIIVLSVRLQLIDS
ncbi:hypothetical protein CIY_09280 [Butyrivibrio fibrisolvens 16/4]|nr:hypothetical protein CIY_09280 [Butyrivibrio fibrisolvens 16/4]